MVISVFGEIIPLDPTMILINVYRLKDSNLGFYHTGLVYDNDEFTFCQDTGIYCHSPRDCAWATYLGSVRLGTTLTKRKRFNLIILGEQYCMQQQLSTDAAIYIASQICMKLVSCCFAVGSLVGRYLFGLAFSPNLVSNQNFKGRPFLSSGHVRSARILRWNRVNFTEWPKTMFEGTIGDKLVLYTKCIPRYSQIYLTGQYFRKQWAFSSRFRKD